MKLYRIRIKGEMGAKVAGAECGFLFNFSDINFVNWESMGDRIKLS